MQIVTDGFGNSKYYDSQMREIDPDVIAEMEALRKQLWDKFAMAALTGLAASDIDNNFTAKDLAKFACRTADAMMEARKAHD